MKYAMNAVTIVAYVALQLLALNLYQRLYPASA